MRVNRIKCGMVNCFLVKDGEDAVLVDTGTKAYRKKVEEACKKVSLSLIVLTHGHGDHAGNAAYLSKKFHVPVAIHKLDYPVVQGVPTEPLKAHTLLGKILLACSQHFLGKEKTDPFVPEVYLKQGQSLEEYGINATVIRLAGHTKGSIGLKIGMTDFIVGDALSNLFIPSLVPIYWDLDKVKQSAQVISQSGDRMIHFGHGKSVRNRVW